MNTMLMQNISKYRKLRGFTQEELAQKLNISSQAISAIVVADILENSRECPPPFSHRVCVASIRP